MTKTTSGFPEPSDETTPSTDVAMTEAPAASAVAPEPVAPEPAVASEPAAPAPAAAAVPVKRSLSTPAIVGIAVGGVLLAGVLFGGGVAVGVALPIGGHSVADTRGGMQGGFPGGDRPGGSQRGDSSEQGTRPAAPDHGTDRQWPSAPNTDSAPNHG